MLDGRACTKAEKRWHDTLSEICGCICCVLDGHPRNFEEHPYVSIHHCDGRTKAHAHWYVLPLCGGHHQPGVELNSKKLPVHGNKSAWIEEYDREIALVEMCAQLVSAAGLQVPDGVLALLQRWYASPQYQERQRAQEQAA